MMRIHIYTVLAVVISWPTSVFATSDSTGVELTIRLEQAIGLPIAPPLVPDDEISVMAQEFDAFLIHAFHAIAGDPRDEIIDWAVTELYHIFSRHIGGEMIDRRDQNFYKDLIRDFVAPVYLRDPKSCVVLLDPRMTETKH